MIFNKKTYKLTDPGIIGKVLLIIGIVGTALSLVGYFLDPKQFFHSYLSAFVYWITIGLGGLFFTMLHHLTNAKWSIVLRRISESIMITLPFMAVFAIPIFFGLNELYHWSIPEVMAEDHLLQKKSGYLNDSFFVIRIAVYFLIWSISSYSLYRVSIREDNAYSEAITKSFRKISAAGMILFAFTITYFSFDLLMSLDAHWYSTIFGVYVFSGTLLTFLAFLTVFCLFLHGKGVLKDIITLEHYHDLARLTFAFVVFWAYIAFSQYFLIWYGNIPEESVWYLHRWEGTWKVLGFTIIFGYFILPFLLLMTRAFKRNQQLLKFLGIWLLVMHYVDIYWLVMPSIHEHSVHVSWIDLAALFGLGGFFLFFLWIRLSSQALVPVNDPRLDESMKFMN
ncbi:hypothetical protein ACFL6G_09210 [candidate division KSB1 bacterium]